MTRLVLDLAAKDAAFQACVEAVRPAAFSALDGSPSPSKGAVRVTLEPRPA